MAPPGRKLRAETLWGSMPRISRELAAATRRTLVIWRDLTVAVRVASR